jgi:monoamine oxidase
LQDLTEDLTVAEFLRRHFAGPLYGALRRSIERMAEGYDAADPERASTQALRDEWMVGGHHTQGRINGGYGALIEYSGVPPPRRCDPAWCGGLRHRRDP